MKLLNVETLEVRRRNNDILFAYDLIKKRIKCNELCSKIIFNEPAPQNLRRRRLLHVDLRRRDYTLSGAIEQGQKMYLFRKGQLLDLRNISKSFWKKKGETIYIL